MELTIKSLRVIKEGMQRDGKTEYKWVSVMADDGSEKGTEYTTFDKAVLKEKPGAVLDIGEIEIKGGKLSFKKLVKVLSKGTGPDIATEKPNSYKKDIDGLRVEYALKAKADALITASIEARTAYDGAVSLLVSRGSAGNIGNIEKLIDAALAWGLKALKASPAPAPIPKPAPETESKTKPKTEPEPDQEIPYFKTGVELVNYALNEKGIPLERIRSDLGIDKPSDIKDIPAAIGVLFPNSKMAPEELF